MNKSQILKNSILLFRLTKLIHRHSTKTHTVHIPQRTYRLGVIIYVSFYLIQIAFYCVVWRRIENGKFLPLIASFVFRNSACFDSLWKRTLAMNVGNQTRINSFFETKKQAKFPRNPKEFYAEALKKQVEIVHDGSGHCIDTSLCANIACKNEVSRVNKMISLIVKILTISTRQFAEFII